MNTDTQSLSQEKGLDLVKVTPELAKAKMNLALTKVNKTFQDLNNKVATIVPNEDNLQLMAETIADAKKIEATLEEAFKAGKNPYWEACKSWDEAKKDLLKMKSDAISATEIKYNELCKAIEARKQKAKEDEAKDKAIQDGINTNVLAFSNKITACKTNKELIAAEASINLERSRTTKYGKHMPLLLSKLDELGTLVKTQKATVQKLEAIQAEKTAAEEAGDDGKLLDLMDQEELVTAEVQQNRINTEEKIVNSTTAYSSPIATAQEVFPEIKGRRQWKMEIVDEAKAYKAGVLTVEIHAESAKKRMAELREKNPKATEFIETGIRYYETKIY